MLWLANLFYQLDCSLHKSCSLSTTLVCFTILSKHDSHGSDISCLCVKRTPVPDLLMTQIMQDVLTACANHFSTPICVMSDGGTLRTASHMLQGDAYTQYWLSAIGHTANVCMLGQ